MKGSELYKDRWEETVSPLEVGGGKYCDEPSGAPEDLKKSNDKLASYIKKNRESNS